MTILVFLFCLLVVVIGCHHAISQGKKKVLLLTNYPWFSYSTPLINTASYLLDHGWVVNILAFSASDADCQLPARLKRDANLCIAPSALPWYRRLIRNVSLLQSHSFGCSLVVLFDGEALLYAPLLLQFYTGRTIYYSLEFFQPSCWLARFKLLLEKLVAAFCFGVITQHSLRADFLRHRLVGRRHFIVPNSPRGRFLGSPNPSISPNQPAQTRNSISPTSSAEFLDGRPKFVLLCIGTLSSDHLVDQLLEWFESAPIEYELILHGWFDPSIRRLAERIAAITHRLVISDSFLSESDKWYLYARSDAVFVGFSQHTPNLALAAGSAGKLYEAIRACRPIIAIDSPGMREIVEVNKIGVVASSFAELTDAVARLRSNNTGLAFFLRAAHQTFSHDSHFACALEAVQKKQLIQKTQGRRIYS